MDYGYAFFLVGVIQPVQGRIYTAGFFFPVLGGRVILIHWSLDNPELGLAVISKGINVSGKSYPYSYLGMPVVYLGDKINSGQVFINNYFFNYGNEFVPP